MGEGRPHPPAAMLNEIGAVVRAQPTVARGGEKYAACLGTLGREAIGREASPTAAVIDSQSVKSAEKGGLRLIRRATTQERRSRARSGIFSSIRKAC